MCIQYATICGDTSLVGKTVVPSVHLLYTSAMKVTMLFLCLGTLFVAVSPPPLHAQGRTSSRPVGASMAMLATLQGADVLPPEGTPEANRIIQMVIQFQALFMKSSDPAVQEFFKESLVARWADRGPTLETTFRTEGWTSEVLEALSERYQTLPSRERDRLAGAFASVNMRVGDFDQLSRLFKRAQAKYRDQGKDIHHIFVEHRRTMPGGHRGERKERRHGDQGLHSYQS
ncbi:MAG TPA: hypothetical protein VIR79_02510 [Nitrospira sp.]